MKVLSLFDGMACAQIALRQLMLLNGFENLRVDTYYASEIDKYAIAQTQHNFPDTVQLGDVERWRDWDIDWEHLDLEWAEVPVRGFPSPESNSPSTIPAAACSSYSLKYSTMPAAVTLA